MDKVMNEVEIENLDGSTRYISFQLGIESYALEVKYVKEILGIQTITPVPQVPHYIRGVMNLRGKIVPVMDVRARFGLEPIEWDRNTSIIVVNSDEIDLGFIVDKMNEVMDLGDEHIRYSSSANTDNTDFLKGMAEYNDQIQMLIDLEQLLSTDDLKAMKSK